MSPTASGAPTLHTTHPSPLGELLLLGTDDGALCAVRLPGQRDRRTAAAATRPAPAAFTEATRQLDAYFAGERTAFDLPLAVDGSDFRTRVWRALDAVPYGSTVSYRELAVRAGAPPRAVRAVGAAVAANPLLIVRPCHRVIGADGSLTGYAGGVDRKRWLLTLEGVLGGVENTSYEPTGWADR